MSKNTAVLNAQETGTTAWQKVHAEGARRLSEYRKQLEAPGTSPARREELVARIDEIKNFLRMGQPAEDAAAAR